jgi:hypothetical protein
MYYIDCFCFNFKVFPLNYTRFGRKLFTCSCWMLQTTGFHICKQKTIDNCTWNLSLKFIEVRIFCYLILVTLWPRSGHNFERHHNNLASVNYLMTTVKIERAFIHLRSHIHLYIIHMTYKPFLYWYHKCVPVCIRNSLDSSMNKVHHGFWHFGIDGLWFKRNIGV